MRCQPWMASFAGAAIAAVLALGGCGPGVGGTGTGGAALTTFGATAASVCGSNFAAELGCAQAPAPAPSSPMVVGPGTLPVQFVDSSGRVTLDVDGNAATLMSSCPQIRFDGEFGHAAGGDAFFGNVAGSGNADGFASLSVAPAPGGGVAVELRGVDGTSLLGPLVLHRATTPVTAPAGC